MSDAHTMGWVNEGKTSHLKGVVGTSRALGQVQDPTALHGAGPGDGHRRHREDAII